MKLRNKIRFAQQQKVVTDFQKTIYIDYNERWVMSQRENVSFAVSSTSGGLLETSVDSSETFTRSLVYPDANKVINAHIFRNGNILFTRTDNRLFLTNFNLDFVTEKTVFLEDGVTPLPIHTPQNPTYPGRYFYTHKYTKQLNDSDLYLVGNYCNVTGGASPVHILYTQDFGKTIKTAYRFGQNPRHRDNGSAGGSTTGALLGDPNNPLFCRHTHFTEFCKANGKWYCCVGDHDDSDLYGQSEIKWMEGTHDKVNDTWNWVEIDFGFKIPPSSFLKVADGFFEGDYFYYASDATSASPTNDVNGIYRVNINHLNDLDFHEKLISFPNYYNTASAIKANPVTGHLLFTMISTNNASGNTDMLGVAENYGTGNVEYKIFPGKNFIRMNSINQKGFFRLDNDRFSTLQGGNVFIKIGDDLFQNI